MTVLTEFELFSELLELRRLLLELDRSTGFGTLDVRDSAGRCVVDVGLAAAEGLDAAVGDGATTTLLVAAGLCAGGCGVLKLLVLLGSSVLLGAAGLTGDDRSGTVAFLGAGVAGPLLLLVSLLPLLSALAIGFGAGFSVSKFPDEVS